MPFDKPCHLMSMLKPTFLPEVTCRALWLLRLGSKDSFCAAAEGSELNTGCDGAESAHGRKWRMRLAAPGLP